MDPKTQLAELASGHGRPVPIRRRAGGAGMQNPPEFGDPLGKYLLRAFEGKIPDGDQPFGLDDRDDGAEMLIAGGQQPGPFGTRQFVGCAIAAGALDKGERTIVHDEVLGKEPLGGAESCAEQFP